MIATVHLVASDLTIAIAFGATVAVVVAIATLIAGLVIAAARDGDDVVGDVQRFIELSAAARAALPPGPLLSDPRGETSAAIAQMLAEKEEARRALWRSRDERTRKERRWQRGERGRRGAWPAFESAWFPSSAQSG